MSRSSSEETNLLAKRARESGPEPADGDEAVNDLFAMADSIRDDELYDVEIVGWEKVGDRARVLFQTPYDGVQTDDIAWPSKPTEDSNFVKLLMEALDIDDPVKATSRADALREGGDAVGATVPADVEDGEWSLCYVPDDGDDNGLRVTPMRVLFSLIVILFGPVVLLMDILDFLDGSPMTTGDDPLISAMMYYQSTIGVALWSAVMVI